MSPYDAADAYDQEGLPENDPLDDVEFDDQELLEDDDDGDGAEPGLED